MASAATANMDASERLNMSVVLVKRLLKPETCSSTIYSHETNCSDCAHFRHGRVRRAAEAGATVPRRRSDDSGNAGGIEERPHDVARAGAAVPRAHRDVRGQDQRDRHRESERPERGGRARSGAEGGESARAAARD